MKTYRKIADGYERLRDSSHVRCLSEKEFILLAEKYGFTVLHKSLTDIPMDLNAWLNLTKTPQAVKYRITTVCLLILTAVKKQVLSLICKMTKLCLITNGFYL